MRTVYDILHRPTDAFLKIKEEEYKIGRIKYGEGEPNDKALNLRGKVIEVYDESGKTQTPEYDFKGNPIEVKRRLAKEYKDDILDWTNPVETDLMPETFIQSTQFDALGRMTSMKNFHLEPSGINCKPSCQP